MRGSLLEAVVQVPLTETQSWDEEFWNVTCAVGFLERSLNFWEWALARKRKSGPERWWGDG